MQVWVRLFRVGRQALRHAGRARANHVSRLDFRVAPGDIVVADNLQCHKGAAVRATIEARGAGLWLLPAYSPDLNPIEQVFAKLKALIRTVAPRTLDDLWTAIGRSLSRFTASECSNYLANSGYPRLM